MYKQLFLMLVLAVLVLAPGCTTTTNTHQSPEQPTTIPTTLPTTGSLELSSTPSGAEIYLNGVYRGTTPSTIPDLPPGSYHVELRFHDYTAWIMDVAVQAGKTGIDATLVPRATPTTVPTTAPTPVPRTILGCFQHESYGWTGAGESFTVTENFWFQPGGVGLLNNTFFYQTPRAPQVSLTGFTWSRDPATALITVTLVGGSGTPAKVYYNGNNDTITFSNSNMAPTIFPRVAC